MLIGEIERGIRRILHGKFTAEELDAAKNANDSEREVKSVADLTFGAYVRLLRKESNWSKLDLEIDRNEIVKRLDKIRDIRNDVMHFNPDGLEDDAITHLVEFANFLKKLREMGVC